MQQTSEALELETKDLKWVRQQQGRKCIKSLQCAIKAYDAAAKEQVSFWDVFKSAVGYKTEE